MNNDINDFSLNKILNFTLKNFNDITIVLYMLNNIIEAQNTAIFLEYNNKLIYVSSYGKNDFSLINQSLSINESVEGYIFSEKKDVLIEKSIETPYFKANSITANIVLPITIVGAPIEFEDKVLGGIIAFNRQRNTLFTEKDLNILKKVAIYISEFLNKFNSKIIDKNTAILDELFFKKLPFPAFILNSNGKIEDYSDKGAEIVKDNNLHGKYIYNLINVINEHNEEINLQNLIPSVITKNNGIIIKNVKITNVFENVFNLSLIHINPERMIHKIFLYFINTEDINEVKHQLITSIAHELRTPMTAIMGSVQILLSDFASGELSPTQKEFLNILKNQSERFSTVLSTILDFKESDLMGLRQETCNLTPIINSAVLVFNEKLNAKSIDLKLIDIDEEMPVKAEINSVKHIFHQILDNAIKFSNEKGTIIIKNEGSKLTDAKWYRTISIKDFGTGIPKDILPNIFESFKRNDEAVHTEIGTGLGLSLVKQIIDTMGGDIEIENHDEGGVIVHLYFLT